MNNYPEKLDDENSARRTNIEPSFCIQSISPKQSGTVFCCILKDLHAKHAKHLLGCFAFRMSVVESEASQGTPFGLSFLVIELS